MAKRSNAAVEERDSLRKENTLLNGLLNRSVDQFRRIRAFILGLQQLAARPLATEQVRAKIHELILELTRWNGCSIYSAPQAWRLSLASWQRENEWWSELTKQANEDGS